jgi:hypothetical protein
MMWENNRGWADHETIPPTNPKAKDTVEKDDTSTSCENVGDEG